MNADERAFERKRIRRTFGNRTDFGKNEKFLGRNLGQYALERPTKQGFSRSGGSLKKDVVSSCGGDFKRALRPFLSGNFQKIRNVRFHVFERRAFAFYGNGGSKFSFSKRFDRFAKGFRSVGGDIGDARRHLRVAFGNEKVAHPVFRKGRRVGYDSADVPKRSVQGEFAKDDRSREGAFFQSALFGHDSEGDGEVESRSGLSDFRGSQIDRDAFLRKGESRIPDGGPNPLAAFLYCGVAQADDGKRRKSGRNVDFHSHELSKKPSNRRGKYGFNHEKSAEK
jgi:hypothetical protein